jgi:GNAT superfamily N-acetyltransferase
MENRAAALEIRAAAQQRDMEVVRHIWREYEAFLQVDLYFQNFEEELASLPGRYAPPKGGLFMAMLAGECAGTVAFYPQSPEMAEIKRLYVREVYRGLGAGRALLQHAMEAVRAAGYAGVRMDSMRRLVSAGKIYEQMGFYEIAPFNHSPHDDAYYLELRFGG